VFFGHNAESMPRTGKIKNEPGIVRFSRKKENVQSTMKIVKWTQEEP
jgi:hypothetical protein